MNYLKTGFAWLDELMPTGLPIRTSTLLSGPGGSGKPLIGDAFVAAWLRAGGSVVFMSLQYPSTDFIYESLKTVAGLDLDAYSDRAAFISLDASLEGMNAPAGNVFKANLVKPDIWDAAIEKACGMVPDEGPGIMVFGSALNLLLFSPTYGQEILERMETLLRDDKRRTYIFSVSTSANREAIARLEAVADNLIMTRSEKGPFRLYMRIVRLKDALCSTEEIQVPIPQDALTHVKEIAEHSRKRVIPLISEI
jgi:KaiC/GvpD/RAD55 family RecA-like ATPase